MENIPSTALHGSAARAAFCWAALPSHPGSLVHLWAAARSLLLTSGRLCHRYEGSWRAIRPCFTWPCTFSSSSRRSELVRLEVSGREENEIKKKKKIKERKGVRRFLCPRLAHPHFSLLPMVLSSEHRALHMGSEHSTLGYASSSIITAAVFYWTEQRTGWQ